MDMSLGLGRGGYGGEYRTCVWERPCALEGWWVGVKSSASVRSCERLTSAVGVVASEKAYFPGFAATERSETLAFGSLFDLAHITIRTLTFSKIDCDNPCSAARDSRNLQ